jgi:hypothetical protein
MFYHNLNWYICKLSWYFHVINILNFLCKKAGFAQGCSSSYKFRSTYSKETAAECVKFLSISA